MTDLKSVAGRRSEVFHLFVDDFPHTPHHPYKTLCGVEGPFNIFNFDCAPWLFGDADRVTCKRCIRKVEAVRAEEHV